MCVSVCVRECVCAYVWPVAILGPVDLSGPEVAGAVLRLGASSPSIVTGLRDSRCVPETFLEWMSCSSDALVLGGGICTLHMRRIPAQDIILFHLKCLSAEVPFGR